MKFLIKVFENSLDSLDVKKPKRKRDIDQNFEDEINYSDVDNIPLEDPSNLNTKIASNEIHLPLKDSSSAFSIRAEKVYILYPSLFQDPNIFGRISIPQNVNLGPVNEKSTTNMHDEAKVMPNESLPPSLPPQIPNNSALMVNHNNNNNPMQIPQGQFNRYPQNIPPQQNHRMMKARRLHKRQADVLQNAFPQQLPLPPVSEGTPEGNEQKNLKRNVETHLTGTIVIQNQDVNEYTQKEQY